MTYTIRRWLAALCVAAVAGPALAADPACQDATAIRWFTPGQFEDARKAADQQKRLIMIKGIAFGVDAVGAKCATKGCW